MVVHRIKHGAPKGCTAHRPSERDHSGANPSRRLHPGERVLEEAITKELVCREDLCAKR